MPERNSGRKVHPRPVAISFTSKSSLGGFEEPKKNSKTAKQAIFENSNVGADIHSSSSANGLADVKPLLPNMFMKPAGVDDPLAGKAQSSSVKDESTGIIDGARKKKPKRPRDTTEPIHEEGKKSTKKKKVAK